MRVWSLTPSTVSTLTICRASIGHGRCQRRPGSVAATNRPKRVTTRALGRVDLVEAGQRPRRPAAPAPPCRSRNRAWHCCHRRNRRRHRHGRRRHRHHCRRTSGDRFRCRLRSASSRSAAPFSGRLPQGLRFLPGSFQAMGSECSRLLAVGLEGKSGLAACAAVSGTRGGATRWIVGTGSAWAQGAFAAGSSMPASRQIRSRSCRRRLTSSSTTPSSSVSLREHRARLEEPGPRAAGLRRQAQHAVVQVGAELLVQRLQQQVDALRRCAPTARPGRRGRRRRSRRAALRPCGRSCCRPRSAAAPARRSTRAPRSTCAMRSSRSGSAASITCSSRSASRASCSVERNAATSSCGRSRTNPTVSASATSRPGARCSRRTVGSSVANSWSADVGVGARQAIEQRRLAGVGVADERDRRHCAAACAPAASVSRCSQHLARGARSAS